MKMLEECFSFDSDFENLEQLLGQTCSIVTELEDYVGSNGKSKNVLRVKWINLKAGPKMTEKERQSLAAQLSAKARRVPAGRKNDNPRNNPRNDPF
jgi:hypothetical protein